MTGIFMQILLIAVMLASCNSIPSGFKSLGDVDPSIPLEMRYFSDHNFVGKRIDGYDAPKCILTKEATKALVGVQKDLKELGYSLLIYDCYRPQRGVDEFKAWAKDLSDTKMKGEFYPDVDKKNLFRDGYIASKSGHSRGSTIDLTIEGLDMGTPFDFFSPLSHTENPKVGRKALANRHLLKETMAKHGFKNYDKEWWHYTLKDEPYRNEYFNFVIR